MLILNFALIFCENENVPQFQKIKVSFANFKILKLWLICTGNTNLFKKKTHENTKRKKLQRFFTEKSLSTAVLFGQLIKNMNIKI